jgi:hypothetical protein
MVSLERALQAGGGNRTVLGHARVMLKSLRFAESIGAFRRTLEQVR